MNINAPDDLRSCSDEQLLSIADRANELQVSARMELRSRRVGQAIDPRPAWAVKMLDWSGAGQRRSIDPKILAIAVLLVLATMLPGAMSSCGTFAAKYQEAQRAAESAQ